MISDRRGNILMAVIIIGIPVASVVLLGLLISANIHGPSVEEIIADLTYFQDPTSGVCFVSYWSSYYSDFSLSAVDCSVINTPVDISVSTGY